MTVEEVLDAAVKAVYGHREVRDPEIGTVVIVTWRDAFFELDEGPPRADYHVRTIGWVLQTDETWITLACEELPDDDGFRAVTHIPVSTVIRVERLA